MSNNTTSMDAVDKEVEALMTFSMSKEIVGDLVSHRIKILKIAEKASERVRKSAHNFIAKDADLSSKAFDSILEEYRAEWRFEEDINAYPQRLNPHGFPHKNVLKKTVQLLDTMENMEHLLKEYGITIKWDQIKKRTVIEFLGEYRTSQADAVEKIISLVKLNNLSQINTINRITAIAHTNTFNRVTDYLRSLDYTDCGYIQQLAEYITVDNGTEHIRDKVLRMWMVMACAAADYAESTPNKEAVEKFDSVMIFVGAQGIGKTRFFRAMLPKVLRSYFNDGITIDPTDKDSVSECIQWWIAEAGEIDGLFRKVDISRFKHFLSRSIDVFRAPFERLAREHQRRTAFVGSANEQEFLKDYTGNRRYWPLMVKNLIIPADESLINSAWAEAWTAYVNGEIWWPQTDFEKDLLSQVASFQVPISGEPIEEAIRDLIKQGNGKFMCDVVKPADIQKELRSNPLGEYKIEKIPNLTVIGKITVQHRIGVRIKTAKGTFLIIRNKEKYEQMKNAEIERYYNNFHSS